MNPAYESALRLAEAGFAVYAATAQKRPCAKLTGWNDKRAARNADDVARMWHEYPDAPAVGVAPKPSGITILDLDLAKDSGTALGNLLHEYGDDWQSTVCTLSPSGGRHYYFKRPKGRIPHELHLCNRAVDVIGTTGAIAPTSVNTKGVYQWATGYSPWEIPVAPMPAWMPAWIDREAAKKKPETRVDRGEIGDVCKARDLSVALHTFLDLSRSTDALSSVVRDEQAMLFLARSLGMDARGIGSSFLCPLHRSDRNPSANLHRQDSGIIMFHDWHLAGTKLEWLSLPEVYAAMISGRPEKLERATEAVWQVRLLIDSGLVDAAPVPMRPLPATASGTTRKVYDGIRHLFACKGAFHPGEPSTLTWRFLARWCGTSQATAQKNLGYLIEQGILAVVGDLPNPYDQKKPTKLYLPVAPIRDPAAAARLAGQIGATLYGLAQHDTNPPWFKKDSKKEQEQHGNNNNPRQLDLEIGDRGRPDARAD